MFFVPGSTLTQFLEPSAPLFQKRYAQTTETEEEKQKKERAQIFVGNTSFENFDLEPRLLKALSDSGFHVPTVVQNSSIPPLLQGKDVLIKVRVIMQISFSISLLILGAHWQW